MITCVVGGQAGSEGKGAVCAHLHKTRSFDAAVRVGGPNAGHSAVDSEGRKWALRQLPVAAVIDPACDLLIAAGSEIDHEVLWNEVLECERAGFSIRTRLYVDSQATMIFSEEKMLEKDIRSGTTGKGIGGARARRALREADLAWYAKDNQLEGLNIIDTQTRLRTYSRLMLEGTQGHALGSHAGYYPFCTSGDCRAIDFMAACGLPPQSIETIVTLRMHPIRIAGNSGPLPGETTWEAIGQEPELTTVTQKVRRVSDWNPAWAEASIRSNAGPEGVSVALMFVDYAFPELTEVEGPVPARDLPEELQAHIRVLEYSTGNQGDVVLLGTGPNTMIEVV